jgi:uncharacterized GH25 family protein
MRFSIALAILLSLVSVIQAHDTWLQTNTNLVRVGDVIHVDLLLGNHGNNHRDFKVAGKVSLEKSTIQVITPDGKSADLKPAFTDNGLGAKEGSWTARYQPPAAGLYCVTQTFDAVVSYAPKRSIKSAKAFFVASQSLDKVPMENSGFDRAFGHPLELVPQTNPVTPMGPGMPMTVKLLFKGQPLTGATVSFIPRGVTLKEGFDDRYERKTNEKGVATFEPSDGNYYLIVAHHATDEKGEGYDQTSYSATLCVYVPALCPCCGE